MNIYRELKIKSGHRERVVSFGEASTPEELEEMFRLRFSVYSSLGYINEEKYPDGLEKDSLDVPEKSKYFIAKIDGCVIGCIRLITIHPLPTQICFEFKEPAVLESVRPDERYELGRFIIIPPGKDKEDYLPRGLVMLFLFDTACSYC
ncbi:MAG: hypothetical protein WCL34_13605, partial [Methylococcaceae bacterium]